MKEFCLKHKWAIALSVVAVVTVLLIYLIGWWTLLAAALVGVAIFFGKLLDNGGTEAVRDFFNRLFKGKNA
ncbi:MAG: hypothetical protein IJK12_02455 [Clostridia bacterium]|jgi:uncharacterized membrane protein|nr:hypothetical protein [Clostridia bacterium]MBR0436082.1 hypothetical protein [Clostridia bacterium]MBR2645780.1 hypothetical protein [Clostridia bacterium]MBR3037882.1 hypothetical protein [Clostridia bacterium]MBR3129051.1 hypothetical protein [Clostridia bacterium]